MALTPSIAADEIISKMTDLMVLASPDGNIIKVNRRVGELLGYAEDELIGRPLSAIIHEAEFINEEFLKIKQDETPVFSRELTYRGKTSQDIPASVFCSRIKDNEGDVIGVVIVGQDLRQMKQLEREIFERRQAEAALKAAIARVEEEKAKSEAVIEAMGDGISIQSTDFRILYQNRIHKEMFGDHAGEYCYSVFTQEDAVCGDWPLIRACAD